MNPLPQSASTGFSFVSLFLSYEFLMFAAICLLFILVNSSPDAGIFTEYVLPTHAKPPQNSSLLNKLKKIQSEMEIPSSLNKECPICMEVMTENKICLPGCHHIFHEHCLSTWLKTPHSVCPYCRADIVMNINKLLNEEVKG